MKVFDFADYRLFLLESLKTMPREGYGQLAKIAQALNISPSIVTLVMQGTKEFSPEQAAELAAFLDLSELETEYFLALVALARAGTERLKGLERKKIAKLRAQAETLRNRMPPESEMPEEAKAIFYSSWAYSAIRMLSSVEKFQTVDALAQRLSLPKGKVREAVEFLVRFGLCVEKNGKIIQGPKSTHIGEAHSLVARHHANWRERAIVSLDRPGEGEFSFTSPVSVARADIPKVRKILMEAVENAFTVIDPSPCEEAACLNLDWFRI